MKEDPVVEIFSGTQWEADMVRSLLKDAEIESFLKNSVLNTYAFEPAFSSEVKVMILESDSKIASEIVNAYQRKS